MARSWFRRRLLRSPRRWLRRYRWHIVVAVVALWWFRDRDLGARLNEFADDLQRRAPQAEQASTSPYDRDDWRHWTDDDHNCRNTRHEVLAAESEVPVRYSSKDRCKVTHGRWRCPFTGRTITDPRKLDVDHMVPLHEAHRSGGDTWSAERKRRYANERTDAGHLIAVDRAANRSKGDQGPDAWLPDNAAYRCTYVEEWVRIKERWSLSMDSKEQRAVEAARAECARGEIPTRPSASG